MFSRFVKKRAERHEHEKIGEFEVKYVIGDEKTFDFGVDYIACGNYNFVKEQGAAESVNTIYFWEHPDQYVRKIWSVLKPKGKVILAFEERAQLERRPLSTDVFHIYHEDDVKHLLSRNGFSRGIEIVSQEIRTQRFHCAMAVK